LRVKIKMAKTTHKKHKFQQFLKVQPKAIELPSAEELVTLDYLQPEQTIPLVISPAINDIDITDWSESNRQFLEDKLCQHGAILFRNCNLTSIADFENLAQAMCPNLFGDYGDLPRTGVSDKIYNATPFPADQAILFHNESSHLHCYPQKIWFFCVQPAEIGGETPIVDCRQIYQLLDEDYCNKAKIEFEWLLNNGLRTRKKRPAIIQHPYTKEAVFFNQIQLHHISYLDCKVRKSLLSIFGEENLPRNVYYGDGSPIEEKEILAINQAYQKSKVSFPWQKGDVLMLDNILTAHSRNPYKGKRKIVVAMGEITNN
jgi:alpha-ketoglutarate-dependent taurine dioxygenase